MKRITRAVALFLALFLLIGLASCTRTELGGKPESTEPEEKTSASSGKTEETETEKKTEEPAPAADPYEIYRAAAEKTRSAKNIVIQNNAGQEMALSVQGQTVPLTVSMEETVKIKDRGTNGELRESHMTYTSSVNGQNSTTQTDVFIDAERIYTRNSPYDPYTVLDRKSAEAAAFNDLLENEQLMNLLPEAAFRNASVSDDGAGSVFITVRPENDLLNEIFADTLANLNAIFASIHVEDPGISIRSATISFEVVSSGYLVTCASQMELDLSMTVEGVAVTGTDLAETVQIVKSVDDPVEIVIPAV